MGWGENKVSNVRTAEVKMWVGGVGEDRVSMFVWLW